MSEEESYEEEMYEREADFSKYVDRQDAIKYAKYTDQSEEDEMCEEDAEYAEYLDHPKDAEYLVQSPVQPEERVVTKPTPSKTPAMPKFRQGLMTPLHWRVLRAHVSFEFVLILRTILPMLRLNEKLLQEFLYDNIEMAMLRANVPTQFELERTIHFLKMEHCRGTHMSLEEYTPTSLVIAQNVDRVCAYYREHLQPEGDDAGVASVPK